MTPRWLAVAYRDYRRCETIMVLPPFHYLVSFAVWLLLQWDRYRHRDSWIDRRCKEAADRARLGQSQAIQRRILSLANNQPGDPT